MIKTLTLGTRTVSFSTSFAWCFVYKAQTGRDPAADLMPALQQIQAEDIKTDEEAAVAYLSVVGVTGIATIAWSMAKLCDQSLPDPIHWVEDLGDDFDLNAIIRDLIPDALISCFASKNSTTRQAHTVVTPMPGGKN